MNEGDLITLILIVGSIVYSIIKGVVKSKPAEDLSKTTLPGVKEVDKPMVFDVYDEIEEQEEPIKISSRESKLERAVTQRTKTTKSSPNTNILEEDTDTQSSIIDLGDIDELKKGIIYAEILNRKEPF
ncbi:hypothetical protein M2138_001543 [Dysgonomonadaceae bacterium PH5-43]|nr:hypothetical protein [Dysgonomonadaceae bacterium PH5-43]